MAYQQAKQQNKTKKQSEKHKTGYVKTSECANLKADDIGSWPLGKNCI